MAVEEDTPLNPVPAEEDEAMRAFIGELHEVPDVDEETNARLLRIIDRNLLPVRRYTTVVVFHGHEC